MQPNGDRSLTSPAVRLNVLVRIVHDVLISSCRVADLSVREWPVLRDLVVRASGTGQCLELAAAVAEAPSAAEAWRHRLQDMCGRSRLLLVVRDGHDEAYAFVAAYIDGEHDARFVVVRHLLVLPGPVADEDTTHLLLDRVEEWAADQTIDEVVIEVDDDDRGMEVILRTRGYRCAGLSRPAFDGVGERHRTSRRAAEWHRIVRAPRVRAGAPLRAVAS